MGAFAGAVLSGLVMFFASKAGSILAGLGLTYMTYTGITTIVGYMLTDVNGILSILSTQSAGANGVGGLGLYMVQVAASCGLFDAVNILIAGVISIAGLMGTRFVLARLAS